MTYERGKGAGAWSGVTSLGENAQGTAKEGQAGETTGRRGQGQQRGGTVMLSKTTPVTEPHPKAIRSEFPQLGPRPGIIYFLKSSKTSLMFRQW